MEFIDVLDERGQFTGKKETRGEVHRFGLWHRTVHVWVMNSEKQLLIQKRSDEMDFCPNMWDISSAGHIEAGEKSIETAMREVKEELGLNLDKSDLEFLFTVVQQFEWNDRALKNNEYNDVYLVKKNFNIDELKTNAEEVAKIKLIFWTDLKEKIDSKDKSFVNHDAEYEELFKYFQNL